MFLAAGQQCTVAQSTFAGKGLQLGDTGDTNNCENVQSLTLYAVPNPGQGSTECGLRCIDGWFRHDDTPQVSCSFNNNATQPDGNTTYQECTRTWYIMGVSHIGRHSNTCHIVVELMWSLDSYKMCHGACSFVHLALALP